MKKALIIVGAVVAVIIVAIVSVNSFTATAIGYEEKITEALSDIKVQEKQRADLIPNLVDCVKAYDKHEYETLVDVVAARTQSDGTISDSDIDEITAIIKFVAEQYPQLSSQQNYAELMKELTTTEHIISETRKAYNKTVSRYNTYTRNPIHKFFLSMTGYEIQEFEKLDYDVSADAPTNLFDD